MEPLGSTYGRTTSGVECQHCLWAAHMVERRRAWHDNTAFGQHTRSNDVGRGMPSSPFGNTNGRTTFDVACHHRRWTSSQSRAWHAIIALGCQTRSNDVRRGLTSPPLDCTHGRQRLVWHGITALGPHTWSDDVGRGLTLLPLDTTHGRTT